MDFLARTLEKNSNTPITRLWILQENIKRSIEQIRIDIENALENDRSIKSALLHCFQEMLDDIEQDFATEVLTTWRLQP